MKPQYSLLWTALVLVFTASARAQPAALEFDPERRVTVLGDVDAVDLVGLDEGLRELDAASSWRYFAVILANHTGHLPELAADLHRTWSNHPDFQAPHDVLVVASVDPRTLTLVLPRPTRDDLGFSPRQIDQNLVQPHRVDNLPLGDSLVRMLRAVDRTLEERQSARDAQRIRRQEAYEDQRARLHAEVASLSSRLLDLERRREELAREGLNLDEARTKLEEARRRFADVLDVRSFDASTAAEGLHDLRGSLAEVEARLNQALADRRTASLNLDHLRQALHMVAQDLGPLGFSTLSPQRRHALLAAKSETRRGAAALLDGHPTVARRTLDRAEAALTTFRTTATASLPPTDTPPSWGPTWLWALGGLLLLAFGGTSLRQRIRRSRAAARVDARRVSVLDDIQQLERELAALRTLYLQARRPISPEVPETLRFGHLPPEAPSFEGETARQLERARAELESLHSHWRASRQAVIDADVARRSPGGEPRALAAFARLPRQGLPVRQIRETAELLERVASARDASAERLAEVAELARRAEARLDDVVDSGFASQPFEDDLGDIVERSTRAVRLGGRDPVASARLVSDTEERLRHLEVQVDRTLDVARGLTATKQRLEDLSDEVRAPIPQDAPSLIAWALHLRDDAAQALEEGDREEAERTLQRVVELTQDAELLERRPLENPADALQDVRQDLHEARQALEHLEDDFAPAEWRDVSTGIWRAAARVELLDEERLSQERIPRLYARLQSVRSACLATTTRLLQLQGERERVQLWSQDLQAQADRLNDVLDAERESLRTETLERLEVLREDLRQLRAKVDDADHPPRWGALLAELKGIEQGLTWVQGRAHRDVLTRRRSGILSDSLEREVDEVDTLLQRGGRPSPAAAARLQGGFWARARALACLKEPGADWREQQAILGVGVRACQDARSLMPRSRTQEVDLALEAGRLLAQAHQQYGALHRLYVLGYASEPTDIRNALSDAGRLLENDPQRALDAAKTALDQLTEATARGATKELQEGDAWEQATFSLLRSEAKAGYLRERQLLIRNQRRQTRFEVLALGEAPNAESDEDLDAVMDEDEEWGDLDEDDTDQPDTDDAADTDDADDPAGPDDTDEADAKAEQTPAEQPEADPEQPASEAETKHPPTAAEDDTPDAEVPSAEDPADTSDPKTADTVAEDSADAEDPDSEATATPSAPEEPEASEGPEASEEPETSEEPEAPDGVAPADDPTADEPSAAPDPSEETTTTPEAPQATEPAPASAPDEQPEASSPEEAPSNEAPSEEASDGDTSTPDDTPSEEAPSEEVSDGDATAADDAPSAEASDAEPPAEATPETAEDTDGESTAEEDVKQGG